MQLTITQDSKSGSKYWTYIHTDDPEVKPGTPLKAIVYKPQHVKERGAERIMFHAVGGSTVGWLVVRAP